MQNLAIKSGSFYRFFYCLVLYNVKIYLEMSSLKQLNYNMLAFNVAKTNDKIDHILSCILQATAKFKIQTP